MLGKSVDPTVRTERIKLMASGSHLVAVAAFVGANVTPLFNSALTPSIWMRLEGGIVFAVFELIALRIPGYLAAGKGT